MMSINYPIVFLAALVPMVVGFVWYNDKVMGKVWQKASGTTDEMIAGSNMLLILGLSYFFSCMLSMMMMSLVIHQFQVQSLFVSDPDFADPNSETNKYIVDFFDRFGDKHRTWSHGAVHGGFLATFVALPLIAINALFERRGYKYILVHWGYWLITMTIMGAILCDFV